MYNFVLEGLGVAKLQFRSQQKIIRYIYIYIYIASMVIPRFEERPGGNYPGPVS